MYGTISQKTKIKEYYEGDFLCSNCHAPTTHKLFLVEKDIKINSIIQFANLENAFVLQCKNCGLEKVLEIENKILRDKPLVEKTIAELLLKKDYILYSKDVKECKNCGSVIGNIFEMRKTTDVIKCSHCGQDASYLILADRERVRKHNHNVGIVLMIIFGAFILQMILSFFGVI